MTPQEIVAELDRIRERVHANALHSAGGVHDLLDALIARLGEKNAKLQRKAGKDAGLPDGGNPSGTRVDTES